MRMTNERLYETNKELIENVVKDRLAGDSFDAIGRRYGKSESTIGKYFQIYHELNGLEMPEVRTKHRKRKMKIQESKDEIIRLHKEEGLNCLEIASKFDCHRTTVYGILVNAGVYRKRWQ